MSKKEKFNLQNYIINQAVNFDKLPWNRKDINFALFWPVLNAILIFITLIKSYFEKDFMLFNKAIDFLVLAVPLLYLCWKRYVFMMFVAVAWLSFWNSPYLIIVLPGFYLAARVELYRQYKNIAGVKNWKQDILKALIYDAGFIALWVYYNIPFIWYLMTTGQI